MGAAIWSAPANEILDFPAENFVAFFDNHRLLHQERPVWRTVKGGSRRYVDKLTQSFRDIRLGCAVTRIERTAQGVVVHDSHGRHDSYDHVVIAAHSDQALSMLWDADPAEREILGAIRYSPNIAYLHRDSRLMPQRRRAWASWNFLRWRREGKEVQNDVAVTYWMNRLQGIDPDKPLFVSLNPPFPPAPELTFGRYVCEHPQYNAQAFAAQRRLDEIQGRRHTWFCGAWTGYGFHEDGLRSGLAVAEALGGMAPWRKLPADLAEAAE
jgi:predicted NAD/FAD-binding protein